MIKLNQPCHIILNNSFTSSSNLNSSNQHPLQHKHHQQQKHPNPKHPQNLILAHHLQYLLLVTKKLLQISLKILILHRILMILKIRINKSLKSVHNIQPSLVIAVRGIRVEIEELDLSLLFIVLTYVV